MLPQSVFGLAITRTVVFNNPYSSPRSTGNNLTVHLPTTAANCGAFEAYLQNCRVWQSNHMCSLDIQSSWYSTGYNTMPGMDEIDDKLSHLCLFWRPLPPVQTSAVVSRLIIKVCRVARHWIDLKFISKETDQLTMHNSTILMFHASFNCKLSLAVWLSGRGLGYCTVCNIRLVWLYASLLCIWTASC